jgi:hypothetical protein
MVGASRVAEGVDVESGGLGTRLLMERRDAIEKNTCTGEAVFAPLLCLPGWETL